MDKKKKKNGLKKESINFNTQIEKERIKSLTNKREYSSLTELRENLQSRNTHIFTNSMRNRKIATNRLAVIVARPRQIKTPPTRRENLTRKQERERRKKNGISKRVVAPRCSLINVCAAENGGRDA